VFVKSNVCTCEYVVALGDEYGPTSLVVGKAHVDSPYPSLDDVPGIEGCGVTLIVTWRVTLVHLHNDRATKDAESGDVDLVSVVPDHVGTCLLPLAVAEPFAAFDGQNIHYAT
jgi:hypothetical protein